MVDKKIIEDFLIDEINIINWVSPRERVAFNGGFRKAISFCEKMFYSEKQLKYAIRLAFNAGMNFSESNGEAWDKLKSEKFILNKMKQENEKNNNNSIN